MSDDKNIIRVRWCGHSFHPAGKVAQEKAKRLDMNEFLGVELLRDRSIRSHNHQFAEIKDLWLNIPEQLHSAPYAATSETFRKHGLIVCGHHDAEVVTCGCPEAAERVAAVLSTMANKAHGYAITRVEGSVVTCFTPKSQTLKAMGNDDFQASKTAVLDWCKSVVDV